MKSPLTVLERTYQEAFSRLGLADFGRALLAWLGITLNGNNLPLTLGDVEQPFIILQLSKEVSAMANTICCAWINASREVESQFRERLLRNPFGLKDDCLNRVFL